MVFHSSSEKTQPKNTLVKDPHFIGRELSHLIKLTVTDGLQVGRGGGGWDQDFSDTETNLLTLLWTAGGASKVAESHLE